ncbi:MAG: nuclear pore complex subunit [Bacteroidetes bacterium]|nr:SiaC family regulatory phosphoprotein [Bacteroidia bacterium]MBN4052398.1 SiaC family regulatory phosphoprotein [Sphingobacteriaceae bacterium AH-315-L07]PCH69829.1 MAG: nuclear pore complex subunit [Bacteroidota bacterium]
MPQRFELEATQESPSVLLDKDQNKFEIKGRSLPEDAQTFYHQIRDWFNEYAEDPNALTELRLILDYINTSSGKELLELLINLENISKQDKEVIVKFYCKESDDIMKMWIEEIAELSPVRVDLIYYEEY